MDTIRRYALCFAILLACPFARAADEEIDVKSAMTVAEAWLAGVDAGRYGASWDEAAKLFQDALDRTRWEVTIERVRGPLGVAVARKLRTATYSRTLPNAPAGEYIVIQYDTRFENRPLSTEIVTPMREPDGTWKVSGYIIR
jgi:hypothetical protein